MPVKQLCAALILVTLSLTALCQKSDVLLLQKNNRTIANFYGGSNISFLTTDRLPVSGRIDSIRRDSIFLTNFSVRQVMTSMGATLLDTTGRFALAFSVNNIGFFKTTKRQPQGFWGRVLLLGGSAFLGVNLVNTLREKQPPFGKGNLPVVLGAVGTAALGFGLLKLTKPYIKVGGKYHLKYLVN